MNTQTPPRLPLLAAPSPLFPFTWREDGSIVSRARVLADICTLMPSLPDRPYAVNLCEDRYLFTVAFAAVAARGQANLLPGGGLDNKTGIDGSYSCYRLTDADVHLRLTNTRSGCDPRMPEISADQVVAIPFTSGTTGAADPHPKRWGELVAGARLAERRFALGALGAAVVATVPPRHMYGLETSVLLPLTCTVAADNSRPFFPEDIRVALARVTDPRVLVTTPAHLRVCVAAEMRWPPVACIISATAPLSDALAAAAEAAFDAPVYEIYGCTEAGSVASRRTVLEPLWTPYDGFSLAEEHIHAAHLAEPVRLNDVVELHQDGRFALLGRNADLVNIAGKRTSLQALNWALMAIPDVDDGTFIVRESDDGATVRLAAAAVAPGREKAEILAALAARLDPVFLPRPLILVDALPRNNSGKLPRQALLALLAAAEEKNSQSSSHP